MPKKSQAKKPQYSAVDLFSGCGGLTLGLKRAGFTVLAAVENDALACSTYRANHPSVTLIERDIRGVAGQEIIDAASGKVDLIAGCPPCQGFSSIRTKNGHVRVDDPNNELVFHFIRLVAEVRPSLVMMENVPGLAEDHRAQAAIDRLTDLGFRCRMDVFDAQDFGAPQRRRRMILVAAASGNPSLASPARRTRTVRGVIGRLPKPKDSDDKLHNYVVKRSATVTDLIRSTPKDGGSRRDVSPKYTLECHRGFDGFRDVYGRMAWGRPSPTITGGCINPSKGRFLHPEQDRAITLREAAMLQGFPRSYQFDLARGRYPAAQMIGNAFPPIFAQKHASALLRQYRANSRAD